MDLVKKYTQISETWDATKKKVGGYGAPPGTYAYDKAMGKYPKKTYVTRPLEPYIPPKTVAPETTDKTQVALKYKNMANKG